MKDVQISEEEQNRLFDEWHILARLRSMNSILGIEDEKLNNDVEVARELLDQSGIFERFESLKYAPNPFIHLSDVSED